MSDWWFLVPMGLMLLVDLVSLCAAHKARKEMLAEMREWYFAQHRSKEGP